MKVTVFCILFLLFAGLPSKAQDESIQPFADAWKVSDTSQSHKAQVAFDDLHHALVMAQSTINRERNTHNIILVGIALIMIIGFLLCSKYRLNEKYQKLLIQRQQEMTELEEKNAKEQIAAFASHIMEKNKLIEMLQQQLAHYEQSQSQQILIENLAQYSLVTDAEWVKFRAEFTKAYPSFLSILHQQFGQFTPAEERLSTLIYLQLNNSQIANTLGISKDSVSRSKRRLKQRLNLADTVTIEDYLLNLLATNK